MERYILVRLKYKNTKKNIENDKKIHVLPIGESLAASSRGSSWNYHFQWFIGRIWKPVQNDYAH